MKLIWALILLTVSGCGPLFGTGTGNPFKASGPANAIVIEPASVEIYAAVCQRIKGCHPASVVEECRAFINAQTTFANPMGITTSPSPTSYEIARQEANGGLTANWTSEAICEGKIDALACGDAAVQAAFVAGATDPYSAAASMLAQDCKGMFGP